MSAAVENGGSAGDQTSQTEGTHIDQSSDQLTTNDQTSEGENNRTFPKKSAVMEGSSPTSGGTKPEPASTIGAATGDFVVRCRGLPWSCTEDDIKEFLGPAGANVTEVHFTLNREGRPSGEAYIALSDDNSYQAALAKDRDNMGHRYIEVFASKRTEMDHVIGARGTSGGSAHIGNDDGIVRLRGLPFGCTKEEIANFFLGMEIAPNGIVMPYDHRSGKSTGESYVCFVDKATAEKAIQKHMHNIQHRYIEVFRSSQAELDRAMRVMTHGFDPMDRRGGGGGGGGGGGRRDDWEGGYGGPSSRPGPYDRPGEYGMYREGSRSGYNSMFGGDYGGGGYGGGGGGGGGWDYDGYGPRGGYGSYGDDDGYYGRPAGGGPVRAGRGGRGGMGGGYGRPAARPETDGGSAPFGKHCIKMRGLPYRAAERDIIDFFAPLRVAKIHILTEYGSGRPSGEGRVEFFTHLDAVEAMKRDREHMGSRYVELFLESDASDRMLYPDYSRDGGY